MPTIRFCSIAFNVRRTHRAAAGRREISNRVPHAAWLPAAVLAVLVPLLSSTALAQSTTGSIYGQITDPSGAVVIGAHVTALNQATGVIYPSDSDGQGNYAVFNLLPGVYKVTIEKDGFAGAAIEGV